MKVLIYCQDESVAVSIAQAVEAADHQVCEVVETSHLVSEKAIRHSPQLLFAVDLSLKLSDVLSVFFPDLRVHNASTESWLSDLKQQLSIPPRPYVPRPYADETRQIYHDEQFRNLSKGKIHRPTYEPGWEEECKRQEMNFLFQLKAAQTNHNAAKSYFACLKEQQQDVEREIMYRIWHDSYKGLCWSRDLAARYCSVLAHYVHGVNLDYLPAPHPASPKADWVHFATTKSSAYAITAVASGHPRFTALGELIRIGNACFTGQSEPELMEQSLQLFGLAKSLQQVAECQIAVMDQWMDADRCKNLPHSLPRASHRQAGVVREFWDLIYIIRTPAPLNAILSGFHAGTTRLEEYPSQVPSIPDFERMYREVLAAKTIR